MSLFSAREQFAKWVSEEMFGNKVHGRSKTCINKYREMISTGLVKSDQFQIEVLVKLDAFIDLIQIKNKKTSVLNYFSKTLDRGKQKSQSDGLYLYGSVGTGKSMLMDIFFESVKEKKKTKLHFHTFMQQIHESIDIERQKGITDPISSVSVNFAKNVVLLCLDEFQITDIADAMIVGRLFTKLIEEGVFIVTTSNRNPDDLYKNGLNRQLFIPFIDLFKEKLEIVRIRNATDYRREKLAGYPVYFFPINKKTKIGFDEIWSQLVEQTPTVLSLEVKGRKIELPNYHNGICKITFSALCEKPLGAADYLKMCDYLKVLFIENIPLLDSKGPDCAKRFVVLIDTLYEKNVKIICLAGSKPENLYRKGIGSFEFSRTVSRLYEMQSEEWLDGLR